MPSWIFLGGGATVTSPTCVLDLTIHLDFESNPPKEPPSSDHALVAPDISPFLSDDHSESDPLEDSSEEDTQSYMRPLLLAGEPLVRKMLIARKRVHPFPARIPANCRRSRYVSSSSSPLPQKRRKVSPHSSSSASPSSSSFDAPSRKRGRSPTTSLSAADRSPAALSPARADLLPPRKRLMGLSSAFHQENSIEDSTDIGTKVGVEFSVGPTIKIDVDVIDELDILHVLPEQTMEERLEEHEEVIQEMHEHPLEMPLQRMEEVEEEIRTLTSRLETTKAERTALRDRVRSLEMSEMSFCDTLRFERERFIGVQRHLGYVSAELRRSRMSRFANRESFKRIETFMIRCLGYRP
ncbi:hypothetical protein Tco_0507500 [Tanacetum coccineum]